VTTGDSGDATWSSCKFDVDKECPLKLNPACVVDIPVLDVYTVLFVNCDKASISSSKPMPRLLLSVPALAEPRMSIALLASVVGDTGGCESARLILRALLLGLLVGDGSRLLVGDVGENTSGSHFSDRPSQLHQSDFEPMRVGACSAFGMSIPGGANSSFRANVSDALSDAWTSILGGVFLPSAVPQVGGTKATVSTLAKAAPVPLEGACCATCSISFTCSIPFTCEKGFSG